MSTEVLLMAYGGPATLDDVPEYLLDVRGGRPTAPPLVAEITERYRRIGGGSPILSLTRAQASGLEARIGLPVRVGMRHWHPYIEQAVREAGEAGASQLIALPMSPFYSTLSIGAYADKLRAALSDGMRARLIHSWHLFPPYIAAVAEGVRAARQGFEDARVIFTAHSLPARLRDEGDPYDGQLRAAAKAVATQCGIRLHDFAYQSPGKTPEPWMGPFIEDVIEAEASQGVDQFLLVPIGFVCDHVEVLYDIDVVLRELCASLQVEMRRSASLNDSPAFVEALAALVSAARDGRPDAFTVIDVN